MTARLDRIISIGLVGVLIFSAIAHGVVEPWSIAAFELIIATLLLLWVIRLVIEGHNKIIFPQVAFPITGLIFFGLIQSIALTDGGGRVRSLSLDTEATRKSVAMLFFLLVWMLMSANFLSRRRRLQSLGNFLILYGFAMAVFALVQHFAWNGSFYWLRPISEDLHVFGPFVNHNHFAGYMEMLIPLPLAFVVMKAGRIEVRMFYAFAAIMMSIALIASLSRGGMVSLAVGMLFVFAMSIRLTQRSEREEGQQHHRHQRRFPAIQVGTVLAISVVIVLGVFWVGSDHVADRIARSSVVGQAPDAKTFSEERGWIWKDTLTMIKANALTGIGLGAFQTAYPIYTKRSETFEISESHNDYLQIIADAGILGGMLAIWFLVVVVRTISRSLLHRDRLLVSMALGSGGGIIAILVHSLFDFNLQLPSNALLFLLHVLVVTQIAGISLKPKSSDKAAAEKIVVPAQQHTSARAASH